MIVDQDKYVDTVFRAKMERAYLFLDQIHEKDNLMPKLGS